MKVAVIGAGNFGAAFVKAAVTARHEVSVSARHWEHAEKLAADAGAVPLSNRAAVEWADVVVLAVPGLAAKEWADGVAAELTGKVLVDATNPMNEEMSDLFTGGSSNAEELQKQVPAARVVKAFNTIFASRLNAPEQDGTRLDAFVAADDQNARETAVELAESLGFAPRNAGGLRMARALEEMAFLHIAMNAMNNWVWQSAVTLVGPTAA